jgi:hypothetical protein
LYNVPAEGGALFTFYKSFPFRIAQAKLVTARGLMVSPGISHYRILYKHGKRGWANSTARAE